MDAARRESEPLRLRPGVALRRILLGGTLIDGTGAPPRPDAAVVVEDGRITDVGRSGDLDRRADDELVQCTGATLLPGLINAHEHLTLKHMRGAYYELHLQEDRLQMLRMAQGALVSLTEGITTVRDCGAYGLLNVSLRTAIDGGVARGPRIVTCGQVIQPAQEKAAPLSMSREADDAQQVRAVAKELIDAGADFIKVKVPRSVTGGTKARAFGPADLRAAAETAHEAGKRITFHAMNAEDVGAAVKAGADAIEHALSLEPDAAVLDEMARRKVTLVPCWQSWGVSQHGTAERRDRHRRLVGAAIAKGVPLATGTDLYARRLVDEIVALSEIGLGPAGAIEAATRLGAEVCGRSDDIGTIERGKRADVLVIDGDPLSDLRVLGMPRLVLKDGVTVFRAAGGGQPLEL